ncbi:MAG TPA: hypothetical protein DCO83_13535, partial [Mucilaginibacter sp.]|nr:hypothetical protein [Mucilaginibacter sp.]
HVNLLIANSSRYFRGPFKAFRPSLPFRLWFALCSGRVVSRFYFFGLWLFFSFCYFFYFLFIILILFLVVFCC